LKLVKSHLEVSQLLLLIAPKGIEIGMKLMNLKVKLKLLIAPKGIEI